jgi:hypothetical protein
VIFQNGRIQPLFIQFESHLIYLWGRLILLSSISSLVLFKVSSWHLSCLLDISYLLKKLSMSLVDGSSPHMHIINIEH